jgi:hypothetical protein
MRLRLDGREVLAAEVPRHFQYTGWGRLNGARRGSAEPPEAAHVRHDIGYLGGPAAAILPYDLSTGVAEAVLAGMARLAAQPGWDEPFHPRGVQTQMGLGGARPDLGQTTHWQAAWLLSGDRRAARVALGQAEAAANIPWHFWDPTGGARGSGGWLDVTRWPGIWTDPRGGPPPRGLSQPVAPREQTGWAPLPSHAPALSYVPYLLTGRRAFLDNQSAQAAWTVVGAWPAVRQLQIPLWPLLRGQPTPAPAEDMLVAFGQPRTGAWNLRTLGETAWIAPDDDPNRAHFADVEARNWAWLLRMIPEWTALQGEAHGYMMQYGFGRQTGMTLFQSEYYASTAARAALRGNAEARAVAAWMRNFLVGRFLAEAQGFAREDAIAYVIAITEEPPPAAQQPPRTPFRTWAEIGRATQARNLGNGPTWRHSDGEYGRLALLSLALLHHALGDPDALAAYDWLAGSGAPHTRLEAFQRMPQHNVAPRGRARVASGTPACARAPG